MGVSRKIFYSGKKYYKKFQHVLYDIISDLFYEIRL